MAKNEEAVLTLHGLDGDNKLVRADVFSRKLRAFLAGLTAADMFANGGKKAHQFMIEDLVKSSAQIKVRERRATKTLPRASGVDAYGRALTAVYNGDRSVERLPSELVTSIRSLSQGAGQQFAHGDVEAPNSLVRIDDFMRRQSERARDLIVATGQGAREPFYQGIAVSSFDGVLKVIDSRGKMLRAKLITTAGAVEIDCVVRQDQLDEFKEHFDKRVRIEGTAHYDAESALPVRVDVHAIVGVKADPDLLRWRGAFTRPERPDEDWH